MLLTDSGFWIALGNRRDRHHAVALAAAKRWSSEGINVIVVGGGYAGTPLCQGGLDIDTDEIVVVRMCVVMFLKR